MRFAFTPEQEMIGEAARQLFADHAASERTRMTMASDGFDRDLWHAFARELGLAGTAIPEEQGGVGLGLTELAIVTEAAGRHVAAIPLIASLGLVAPALLAGGTADQQTRWLPRLVSGDAVAAWAEVPDARSADGTLSGTAPLVAHGAVADIFVVISDAGAWVVERGPGVSLVPQVSMDQTRPLARLVFDQAPAQPLADPTAARAAAERWGWALIAADALGGAQACLDRTAAYACEREQFGRAIGTFQAVKHALADVAIAVEQARSAVYWAAAEPDDALAAHAAKAVACQAYSDAAAAMIQLHGGVGFTWEHDAHLFFKRARADHSWLGTPEWHLDRVAALMPLDDAA